MNKTLGLCHTKYTNDLIDSTETEYVNVDSSHNDFLLALDCLEIKEQWFVRHGVSP